MKNGKTIIGLSFIALAVVLVAFGIAFGDPAADILRKARMICLECMGLG